MPAANGTRIRTPDQRLRVFVSSTLGKLAEERQAASGLSRFVAMKMNGPGMRRPLSL
jgi:hypothetical protein